MQSLSQGTSIMEISRKYGLSRNTIKKYRNLLRDDGVNMPPITDMDDEQLSEQLQSPVKEGDNYTRYGRLKARKEQYLRSLTQKHMTKQLLWEQYKEEEEGDNAYSNSQFSYYLHKWESQQKTVMVLGSKPGDRLEVASQLPIEKWYEYIGDPTLADAIMDRLIYNAHKIELKGASMRERGAKSQALG